MAAENVQGESISENVKKQRNSYLSYLSDPLLKVPRTSKHRQKLSKEDCASFKDKASGNSCQTIDNNYGDRDYSDSSDERDDICLEDCGSFDLLEGFLLQKETRVDAQDYLADGSLVNGTVNELFCSGFHEGGF